MARHQYAPHPDLAEPCEALDDRSEDFLRQIVEHAGVGLFATAIDGSFRAINRALVLMLGYDTVDELLADGRSANSFYVDPTDQERVRQQIERTGVVRGMVYRVKRRDGTRIWVSEHGSAVRDADGTILSYVGSLGDVTEVIDTQTKLAEAEASYRRIFERVTEGIFQSSLDGHPLRSNPALTRLNGYTTEEEHLRAVKDIATEWYVDPKRRDTFKRLLDENGFVENFESEVYRHKTRERIWVSENAYVVSDNDGSPLYYEGTVRNITDQKTAELATQEALKRTEAADRAKTRFLAHMSHELRTPLNAILGFSDMMRSLDSKQLSPEKVREYADDIHKSGAHLLDLINDILDLSRIESDAVSIHLEPIAPQDLVDEALQTIGPIAQTKSIKLAAQIGRTGPALVDRRAMHQCLLNVPVERREVLPGRRHDPLQGRSRDRHRPVHDRGWWHRHADGPDRTDRTPVLHHRRPGPVANDEHGVGPGHHPIPAQAHGRRVRRTERIGDRDPGDAARAGGGRRPGRGGGRLTPLPLAIVVGYPAVRRAPRPSRSGPPVKPSSQAMVMAKGPSKP